MTASASLPSSRASKLSLSSAFIVDDSSRRGLPLVHLVAFFQSIDQLVDRGNDVRADCPPPFLLCRLQGRRFCQNLKSMLVRLGILRAGFQGIFERLDLRPFAVTGHGAGNDGGQAAPPVAATLTAVP